MYSVCLDQHPTSSSTSWPGFDGEFEETGVVVGAVVPEQAATTRTTEAKSALLANTICDPVGRVPSGSYFCF